MKNRRPKILCVNCNIHLTTHKRYHLLDSRVCAMISNWITDDDVVCKACWELAMEAVNQDLSPNVKIEIEPRQLGHTHVCLLCGCSLLHKQRDKILRDNATELQENMVKVIQLEIQPRQLTPLDRVCHPCWLRTKRKALRTKSVVEVNNEPEEDMSMDNKSHENLKDPEVPKQNVYNVVLPNYRRAKINTHRCVFANCTSKGKLRSVYDNVRALVLNRHKYYLPKLSRVCDEHLAAHDWDILYDSPNSMDTFSVEQIEHVFSLVNAYSPNMDFENINEMDESVFEYLAGFSKEKFKSILEEVPRISELRFGEMGLMALLIKSRTGDSNTKLATLMNKPRRTLEGLMDKVREILGQDIAPNEDASDGTLWWKEVGLLCP
ncbi:uncharacterized protein LOC112057726 isoform X2 [Bicyclus anynana]|uniref:Uncharacterized protein LOC112057726 isoform X2 n=1 Tax=Bicyclus anynana TaxID=110368 RepID=A0A6J1P869_BICAN|nr:uncharacterized protein LOC112057726 isoform X2 [Bicyclus anynana]